MFGKQVKEPMQQWHELYSAEHEPSDSQIKAFVETPLLDDLNDHLQQEYKVKPKLSYSNCSMDKGMWKGWNIKYKKSGKSLCTLYPKQGFLLALMPVGLRELPEAELVMPLCTEYTQNLFNRAACGHNGKSLALEVKNDEVLEDIKQLIAIRAKKV